MNVFHCCVQKTASQWFKAIFHDPRIVELSGLRPYDFYEGIRTDDVRLSSEYTFTNSFPDNTVVTPLYISFRSFCTISKGADYRAFFVMRDPRDLVVSWYFSTRYSHPNIGKIQEHREILNKLPIREGLIFSIDFLQQRGYFTCLESWIEAPNVDTKVKLLKYEDVTSPGNYDAVSDLLEHCQIKVKPQILRAVLDDLRFEKLAERKQGIEDQASHYRKGIEGDWVNYFDDEVEAYFGRHLGRVTDALGYHATKVDLLKKQLSQTKVHLQEALQEIHRLQQQNIEVLEDRKILSFQQEPFSFRGQIRRWLAKYRK